MILSYSDSRYRITYGGVSMVENALGNPNLVQIALMSGCTIQVAPDANYGITYKANGEYAEWRLDGINTHLNRIEAHNIYVRVNRADDRGLIIFSVNRYRTDGKIFGEGAEITPPSAESPMLEGDYYYFLIGNITATDSLTKPTQKRQITLNGGYLATPQNTESQGEEHFKNKEIHITAAERKYWNAKLDKSVWDAVFYQNDTGLHVRINLIGDKEVSAYGIGNTQAPSGVLDLVNSLTSDRTDAALTAAMGKELKRQIDTKTVSMDGYATQMWVKQQGYITGYVNNYLTAVRGSGNAMVYFDRQGMGTLSLDFSHTHSEYLTQETLDAALLDKLDKKVWDNVFYQDQRGLHVRVNLIGDQEVSAYGIGETHAPSGVLDLVNSLTSDRTDAALTAAMGKELKRQIDTKTVSMEGYATQTWVQQQGYITPTWMQQQGYATQTWVQQQKYLTSYVNNYLTAVRGNGNGLVYFDREGLNSLSFNFAHSHAEYLTKEVFNSVIGDKLDKKVWDDVFYTDKNGIHVKVNLIGDKEVSAYGLGETHAPSGVLDLVNSLTSDRTDAALTAAMGKELKRQIDAKPANLDGYATQIWVKQQGYITGYVNNYLTAVRGNGNGMVYFDRQGMGTLSLNFAHTHSEYLTQKSLEPYYQSTTVDNLLAAKASTAYVNQKIADLVNGAPATLDTLKEIADALASNKTVVDAINAAIVEKAEKDGKNATGIWPIGITGNAKTASAADRVEAADKRDTDEIPSQEPQGLKLDFKKNTANGLKDGGEYNTVLTLRGYGWDNDFTGGYPAQLAFTQNGNAFIRTAKGDVWGTWGKVWTAHNFDPDSRVSRQGRFLIYTDNKPPYNFVHLFRVANKAAWSCLRLDIDIKSRYYAAKLYLDLYCNENAFGEGVTYFTTSQSCANGRKAEIYIKRTTQTADYNYYDVYIKSGSWDKGYYDIVSEGGNGTIVFEHKGKRLETLPEGCAKIVEKLHVNGSITATGEITAHLDTAKTLEETPMTLEEPPMILEEPPCIVYDGLDSTESVIALSANQGRILASQIKSLQEQINLIRNDTKR